MVDIESVKRLDIKPGDTVVVRIAAPDPDEINRVHAGLMAVLPPDTRVIVTGPDVELTVLSQADQNTEGGIERQAGNLPHQPTFTPPPARQAATTERPIG